MRVLQNAKLTTGYQTRESNLSRIINVSVCGLGVDDCLYHLTNTHRSNVRTLLNWLEESIYGFTWYVDVMAGDIQRISENIRPYINTPNHFECRLLHSHPLPG